MEEEMVEDAANDDVVEYSFTAYEIDLDCEYDAARFFDFSRAESSTEARQAEVWFDSAGSYPPSRSTFYNHTVDNSVSKTETKLSKTPSFQRSSTIMKPTASQLAKQNGPFLTGYPRLGMQCSFSKLVMSIRHQIGMDYWMETELILKDETQFPEIQILRQHAGL